MKNVRLEVIPELVEHGHEAILRCSYELEDAPLYSLKWYRGTFEFYRYSPNEKPTTKIFNFTWIEVNVSILFPAYFLSNNIARCVYIIKRRHSFFNLFHIRGYDIVLYIQFGIVACFFKRFSLWIPIFTRVLCLLTRR